MNLCFKKNPPRSFYFDRSFNFSLLCESPFFMNTDQCSLNTLIVVYGSSWKEKFYICQFLSNFYYHLFLQRYQKLNAFYCQHFIRETKPIISLAKKFFLYITDQQTCKFIVRIFFDFRLIFSLFLAFCILNLSNVTIFIVNSMVFWWIRSKIWNFFFFYSFLFYSLIEISLIFEKYHAGLFLLQISFAYLPVKKRILTLLIVFIITDLDKGCPIVAQRTPLKF